LFVVTGRETLAVVSQNIILVDDDRALRDSLQFALELEGFSVESFVSAEDFAERGRVAPGTCLVVDYRLPGMNGLALLVSLRDQLIDAPALLITTNPTLALRKRALELGAAIVEKPLLSDDLLNEIRWMFVRVNLPAGSPKSLSIAAP
jgi:two-component system response regulator FixJ